MALGNALSNLTPVGTNDNSFVAGNVQVFFSQPGYWVTEGEALEVRVDLSEPRDAPTTVRIAFTAHSGGATGSGVDFDSIDIDVTIPTGRYCQRVRIPTVADLSMTHT